MFNETVENCYATTNSRCVWEEDREERVERGVEEGRQLIQINGRKVPQDLLNISIFISRSKDS